MNLRDFSELHPFAIDESYYGYTQLHWACQSKKLKIVTRLLELGANVNAKKIRGETPLHGACICGGLEIVQELVKYGADVNSLARYDLGANYTPLHLACVNGHDTIAEFLLQNGSDVTNVTSGGETPLHLAVLYNRLVVIKLLLEKMNDIEIKDINNKRPIDYTTNPKIIDMLQNHNNVCYL